MVQYAKIEREILLSIRYEIEDVALDVDRDRDEWIRFTKHHVYDHPIVFNGFEWRIDHIELLRLNSNNMKFVNIFRLKRTIE